MRKRTLKQLDLALLALLPVAATIITLSFRLDYLWSIALLLGPICLWLSLRTPKMVAHTAVFSGALVVPFAIILNYIGIVTDSWYVPASLFSFRVLGLVPIEDLVGCFLLVYGAVICYEHFLDKGRHRLVDRKMKYLVWPLVAAVALFIAVALAQPDLLKIPYAYAWIGVIFGVLPIASTLWFFPRLISKYIKVGSYFALLLFIFEFNGLALQHWVFPGSSFIGWLPYFGYRVPVEEILFFVLLSTISILSYYEFFDDDLR